MYETLICGIKRKIFWETSQWFGVHRIKVHGGVMFVCKRFSCRFDLTQGRVNDERVYICAVPLTVYVACEACVLCFSSKVNFDWMIWRSHCLKDSSDCLLIYHITCMPYWSSAPALLPPTSFMHITVFFTV